MEVREGGLFLSPWVVVGGGVKASPVLGKRGRNLTLVCGVSAGEVTCGGVRVRVCARVCVSVCAHLCL